MSETTPYNALLAAQHHLTSAAATDSDENALRGAVAAALECIHAGLKPEDCIEVKQPSRPQFFECGCCGHFHNINLPGHVDCRQDSTRYTEEQLGATYGAEGWDWVEAPGEQNNYNAGYQYAAGYPD